MLRPTFSGVVEDAGWGGKSKADSGSKGITGPGTKGRGLIL